MDLTQVMLSQSFTKSAGFLGAAVLQNEDVREHPRGANRLPAAERNRLSSPSDSGHRLQLLAGAGDRREQPALHLTGGLGPLRSFCGRPISAEGRGLASDFLAALLGRQGLSRDVL